MTTAVLSSDSRGASSPLVSVIVPTYNRVTLLRKTLDCIFAQTFRDFELIVVDNMSEDGTEEYVTSIDDPRVRYFKNPNNDPNNGVVAVNRNIGIRNARGTYIAFCDDDDLWLPEKLEKQLVHFGNGLSCIASDCIPIGDVKYLDKSLSIPSGKIFHDYSYRDIMFALNPIINSSVMTLKSLLIDEGGFDESADFCFIEDWELWLRLSKKGSIRILAEPLLKYRMYDKPGRDSRHVAVCMLKVVDKHKKLAFLDTKTEQIARANCCVVIGRAFLDFGDSRGIGYYLKGLIGCNSTRLRYKALLGIFMFMLPVFIRSYLFKLIHRNG